MIFGKVFTEGGTTGETRIDLNLLDGIVGCKEQIASMTDAEGVDVLIERGIILCEPLAKVCAIGANGKGKVNKREVRIAKQ